MPPVRFDIHPILCSPRLLAPFLAQYYSTIHQSLLPVLRLSDCSPKCMRKYKSRRSQTLGKALSGGALDLPMIRTLPEVSNTGQILSSCCGDTVGRTLFPGLVPRAGLSFGGRVRLNQSL